MKKFQAERSAKFFSPIGFGPIYGLKMVENKNDLFYIFLLTV
jgi:hypothetical protein